MASPRRTRLLLWVLALSALLMVVVAVSVALLLRGGVPAAGDQVSWLHLRFSPAMADAPGNEGLLMDPLEMPPLTTELTAAIRHAAADPSVEGLLVELEPVGVGWAQTQEIQAAIVAFRASGKPCLAWGDQLTNAEYYLAAACGEIHLAPAGITLVNGLSLTQTYYAGTLEELGVSANFEHVGDFKSAVEPYERTGPSDPAAEATNALLDSLYDQLIAGIAQGRGISPEEARALVDDPPMTPQQALQRRMVDSLSYRDQVLARLEEKERISATDYLRDRRREWMRGSKGIAVIYAEGTIVSGDSGSELLGGRFIGDRTLAQQLKKVREDDSIAAVVLRVNSPGGSGTASDAIWREVELTREEKPVVVSMGDYAASGGYYISMSADRIFAQPGTLTGSIGVFGGKLNFSGLYEKVGLSLHTFSRGQYANLFSATADFNDAEREKFRSFLQSFYDTFVAKAAAGREMTPEALHAVAQGRVWTGEQALAHGLVDQLGGLEDALAFAAETAQIEGEYRVVRYPERKGFIDQLLEEMSDPAPEVDALAQIPDALRAPLSAARQLERVLAVGGTAALLPARIEIR